MKPYDFDDPVAYTHGPKNRFHSMGRSRLKTLAMALALPPGSYTIRSNKGGTAVSGELILHTETFYVQVSQAGSRGILVRTCKGLQDYTGGRNHFYQLDLLNDIPKLMARVRFVLASEPRMTA